MKLLAFFFTHLMVAFVLANFCISCYRMPTENDFSVVPTTNNPAVTCEKPNTILPAGLGY
jgi:hypothetical protein